VSAGALVSLITVYLTGVLKRLRLALGAGFGLATLYAMLYWILRSEDYSLLMGSLLLFGVLAILMIATRRIDWSNVARLKSRRKRRKGTFLFSTGPLESGMSPFRASQAALAAS
jgi:inner membrane protein involved in colicin E2 resistance